MLAQDPFTGNVHEVPDSQAPAIGQVLYDGLGNPVGGLFDTLLSPIRSLVSNIPGVGNLVNSFLPGGAPAPAAPAVIAPPPVPYAQPAPYMQPPMGSPYGNWMSPAMPLRRCMTPVGWTTPALPYTGAAPRRLYLRCSVWPGQAGLVPVDPGQWSQAQAQAGATGAIMAMNRRRGHSRYRRRR